MLRNFIQLTKLINIPTKHKLTNSSKNIISLVKLHQISIFKISKRDTVSHIKKFHGPNMSSKRELRYKILYIGAAKQGYLHLYASHCNIYRSQLNTQHVSWKSCYWGNTPSTLKAVHNPQKDIPETRPWLYH